jgi:hypothetical protein
MSNYPPGAEFDPRAPWNQKDVEVEDRHIERATLEVSVLLGDTGSNQEVLLALERINSDESYRAADLVCDLNNPYAWAVLPIALKTTIRGQVPAYIEERAFAMASDDQGEFPW